MEIASRQKKSLQEAQRSNTSTEFLLWKAFIDQEANGFNPLHYYLAQIAREIVVSRDPKKLGRLLKVENFLIKFVTEKKEVIINNEEREKKIEERSRKSKGFWGAVMANAQEPPKQPKKR